jgi:methyl-accepting chemotaxis protein
MEEMTAAVRQSAFNANDAKQIADANRSRAVNGSRVVSRAIEAMGAINASSKRIADIIGTIDGIAFQTNLLALNAAVEAARAGEQGRGFAVVASEVRSLAQRSAGAARQIKDLIEDSVEKVHNGTQLVDESGKVLEEIIEGTSKVAGFIMEMAAASEEQSSGIGQVNKAVMHMDNTTQQNAALVEEMAVSSQALEKQALHLSELMAFFKLETGAAGQNSRLVVPAKAVNGDTPGHTPAVQPPRSDDSSRIQPEQRKHTQPVRPPAHRKPAPGSAAGDWEEF